MIFENPPIVVENMLEFLAVSHSRETVQQFLE